MSSIVVIIVAFNSNPEELKGVLGLFSSQCSFVVADNSDDFNRSMSIEMIVNSFAGVYIRMNGNVGLALAQNCAIARAWALGATHILLLDDDSRPMSGMLEILVDRLSALDPQTVLGARTVDFSGRDVSNVASNGKSLTPSRDMMSSGTLISRSVFEKVGPFDESLFIDCVDFDWGWRAQYLGIKYFLVEDAKLRHQLGEGRIGWLGVSSPIRHYYQYRNVLKLMVRGHTPWSWRISQGFKLLIKLLLILLVFNHKYVRLKYALRGIFDALIGRSGKYFKN